MLKNREDVTQVLEAFRKNHEDFVIPLGGYDISTPAKATLSNTTKTLYNHLPVVKAIVDANRDKPFYVGLSGQFNYAANGEYDHNVLKLHRAAQMSGEVMVRAYVHELIHLDQDVRGLLGVGKIMPLPESLGRFIVHYLFNEAAAYATEITSLDYLSYHSKLRKKVPEVERFMSLYVNKNEEHEAFNQIAEAMGKKDINDYADMKPAWQAIFQHFFHPDSPRLTHYIIDACEYYFKCTLQMRDYGVEPVDEQWGTIRHLSRIITIPVLGKMFPANTLPILMRQVEASAFQRKHRDVIEFTRNVARHMDPGPGSIRLTLGK